MVSRQDQHVVGLVLFNEMEVLVNGVCGALIPVGAVALLIGRQNVDSAVETVQIPGKTVSDVTVQHQRLILGQNANHRNIGVDAVGQGEVDDAEFCSEGNCGFCNVLGQDLQSAALPSGKKHCNAFFLLDHGDPPLLCCGSAGRFVSLSAVGFAVLGCNGFVFMPWDSACVRLFWEPRCGDAFGLAFSLRSRHRRAGPRSARNGCARAWGRAR